MADTSRDAAGETVIIVPEAIARNWIWVLVLGVALVGGGVAALAAPFVASIAVGLWIGFALLVAGAAQLLQVFTAKGWKGRAVHGASGAIYVLGGLLLVFEPLAGLVALSSLVVAVLLVSGLLRIYAGIVLRPEAGWGWVLGGGLVAVAAAGLIYLSFPGATLILLGVLAGAAFITEGWGMILLGLAARKAR
jgi:uncharacterized membrane protein HdeD (DUF308 family)